MDRLEALSRALQRQPVWSTIYHQEYVPVGMTAGEEVDGVVWVSWPDRAYFQAGDPVVRSMGLDGRSVRLVDLEAGSCDDHVLSDEEWARVPLAAVLDPRGAVEHFSVLGVDGHGLALVPREPGGVARVEVVLTGDSLPKEVVVIDPQGSRNRLVFGQWKAGKAVPGGEWLPQPPQGVQCVGDEDEGLD